MKRDEYQQRQREMSARGMDLPQSKLLPLQVSAIRTAAVRREQMRREINETLSNAALAKAYGVHVRTIEKVLAFESWSHV
jgi:hypothetical protein